MWTASFKLALRTYLGGMLTGLNITGLVISLRKNWTPGDYRASIKTFRFKLSLGYRAGKKGPFTRMPMQYWEILKMGGGPHTKGPALKAMTPPKWNPGCATGCKLTMLYILSWIFQNGFIFMGSITFNFVLQKRCFWKFWSLSVKSFFF